MAILEILVAPDPRLKTRAMPVAVVDDRIRRLLDDMLETMYAAPGIGLAAPQVGEALERVVVETVEACIQHGKTADMEETVPAHGARPPVKRR
jgi:peptide deformylase